MAATNDVTGDAIKTKAPNNKYRENYDAIFAKIPKERSETVHGLPATNANSKLGAEAMPSLPAETLKALGETQKSRD